MSPPPSNTPSDPVEKEPLPPAIPGVRVMAVVRWVLLALVTGLAAQSVWTFWGPSRGSEEALAKVDGFYCPMHPQIRSHEAGECPICHMDLEPIPEERSTAERSAQDEGTTAPSDVMPISASEEQQRSIGVATSVVTEESLAAGLRAPGVVEAPETGRAEVRVRAAGFVERVEVRRTGVRVRGGQILAWIYSPEIFRAQEEFLVAHRWTTGAGAAAVPPPGTAEIARAARLGLALLGLSEADIEEIARTGTAMRAVPVRAPISGYVSRFNATLGARADPETQLYEIIDLSSVWVLASVGEHDSRRLRVGMAARFTSLGAGAGAVKGRIELIEPQVDEATRTARVRLSLPNPDMTLRPGEFGEVTFELPTSKGLFVPRDAIIRTGEHEYVYVATGEDGFDPRIVRTGFAAGERVMVLEGLSAGDRVVTRGSFMLDSESRLRASLAATPQKPGAP